MEQLTWMLAGMRIRQGLLAGSVAGAACGLLLTNFFVVAVFMMVAARCSARPAARSAAPSRLSIRAGHDLPVPGPPGCSSLTRNRHRTAGR